MIQIGTIVSHNTLKIEKSLLVPELNRLLLSKHQLILIGYKHIKQKERKTHGKLFKTTVLYFCDAGDECGAGSRG